MTEPITKTELRSRNKAVSSSYLLVSKVAKQLISRLPQELLRHTIELDGTGRICIKPKLHEFISPLMYLCLRDNEGAFRIHFGFDPDDQFTNITGQFVRMIFKLTMKDYTAVDIEDCVVTHSIITDTSSLIDHTQWKHPSLQLKVIKYKPIVDKRNGVTVA